MEPPSQHFTIVYAHDQANQARYVGGGNLMRKASSRINTTETYHQDEGYAEDQHNPREGGSKEVADDDDCHVRLY